MFYSYLFIASLSHDTTLVHFLFIMSAYFIYFPHLIYNHWWWWWWWWWSSVNMSQSGILGEPEYIHYMTVSHHFHMYPQMTCFYLT